MNACTEWQDKLIDLALGLEAGPELRSHLLNCLSCSETLDLLRKQAGEIDAVVGTVVSADPPSSLADSVMERIAMPPRYRWGWKPALAFVVVIVIFVVLLHRDNSVERNIPDAAAAISGWRSPTGFLLLSSSEGLTQIPKLGETYYKIQTNGGENVH